MRERGFSEDDIYKLSTLQKEVGTEKSEDQIVRERDPLFYFSPKKNDGFEDRKSEDSEEEEEEESRLEEEEEEY